MHSAAKAIAAGCNELEAALDASTCQGMNAVGTKAMKHFMEAIRHCDTTMDAALGGERHTVYCGTALCYLGWRLADLDDFEASRNALDTLLEGIVRALAPVQQPGAVLVAASCVAGLGELWRTMAGELQDNVAAYDLHKMALDIRKRFLLEIADPARTKVGDVDVARSHIACGRCAKAGDALSHFATAKRMLTKLKEAAERDNVHVDVEVTEALAEATAMDTQCRQEQWRHAQDMMWVKNERNQLQAEKVWPSSYIRQCLAHAPAFFACCCGAAMASISPISSSHDACTSVAILFRHDH